MSGFLTSDAKNPYRTQSHITLPGLQFILSDRSAVKHDRTFFISLWRFEQKLVHETKDAYAPLIDLDQE